MEAHHHPVAAHGKKKQFKEYFLEFLMIFLAVTMGFIAESLREHLSDSSKENEYITGTIKNLEVDTAALNFTIKHGNEQMKGIDTLSNIRRDKLADLKVQDSLYKYSTRYLFTFNPFKSDDITIIQLRNAGGYRFIRKEGALDSIAKYESKINLLDIQEGFLTNRISKSVDVAGTVFDFNAHNKLKLNPSSTPVLVTSDKEKINNFYNQFFIMSRMVDNYNQMLEDHLKYTASLIVYLKKTYNVD